jgi:hypothetical protein
VVALEACRRTERRGEKERLSVSRHDLSNLAMFIYMVGVFSYTAYLLWKGRDD